MTIKSALSIIALSTSLAFSGSVMAQTTINGVDVSDSDLPAVQERCDQLSVAENNSLATTSSDSESDTDSAADAGSADANIDDAPAVNEIANLTSTIDLDTITLQACQDAGLVSN